MELTFYTDTGSIQHGGEVNAMGKTADRMRMTRGARTTRRALRRKYSGQHLKKSWSGEKTTSSHRRAGVKALSR